jgi:hypothetical protein
LKFDFLADSGNRIARLLNNTQQILSGNSKPLLQDSNLLCIGEV